MKVKKTLRYKIVRPNKGYDCQSLGNGKWLMKKNINKANLILDRTENGTYRIDEGESNSI